MKPIGKIAEIWRYPVSSMGGERLDGTKLAAGGIAGDRIWGVARREDGEVAGPEKRRYWRPLPNLFSRLAGDTPQIGKGNGDWFDAASVEAEALASSFLDMPVALKPHVPFETEREGFVAPRYQRADLHVLTTASLKALAALVPDPNEIDGRRFRPNIVIETVPELEGFAEHRFVGKRVAIGNAVIAISEPCARCSFTALAQGELTFEPAVLHRIAQHGNGGFGVLCAIEGPGAISLGDEVRLIEE
ncbi:MOSC domain-containing protein [Aquamicrobium sp. LC103]|uniref:MOSC domain-containing protein n=1 Tax=Aquamicrobium sp. LC103 TaxID=1120658 RepID=UPI00063ED283|nr:MOSC domain-containing protein [Aquamicrobium sp. LC103]TKT77419.1 MOSC domain-containing protein [Aquamicrobium sp. LC103]